MSGLIRPWRDVLVPPRIVGVALILGAVTAFGACSTQDVALETRQSIVGGSVDQTDTSVVAVVAVLPDGAWNVCSGTVISPHVILTAAHCVNPDVIVPGTTVRVFTGVTFAGLTTSQLLAQSLPVLEVHYHPDFDLNNLPAGHDVGLVVLSAPTSLAPLPLNRNLLGPARIGEAVRLVGYGVTDGPAHTGTGTRRHTSTPLVEFDSHLMAVDDPAHTACFGDSGGPALMTVGGIEKVFGVNSFVTGDCEGRLDTTRVDAELAFIDPVVEQYDPAPTADGGGTGGAAVDGGAPDAKGADLAEPADQDPPPRADGGGTGDGGEPHTQPIGQEVVYGACSVGGQGAPASAPLAGILVVALVGLALRRRSAAR